MRSPSERLQKREAIEERRQVAELSEIAEADVREQGSDEHLVLGAVRKALPWAQPSEEDPKKLAAFLEGFSLQAGTHVHERDRDGLEHLLRYALRPPLSLERLTRSADGRVVLSLRRPLHDGTTAVAFTPMELLKRLAAIVPPPKRQGTIAGPV